MAQLAARVSSQLPAHTLPPRRFLLALGLGDSSPVDICTSEADRSRLSLRSGTSLLVPAHGNRPTVNNTRKTMSLPSDATDIDMWRSLIRSHAKHAQQHTQIQPPKPTGCAWHGNSHGGSRASISAQARPGGGVPKIASNVWHVCRACTLCHCAYMQTTRMYTGPGLLTCDACQLKVAVTAAAPDSSKQAMSAHRS